MTVADMIDVLKRAHPSIGDVGIVEQLPDRVAFHLDFKREIAYEGTIGSFPFGATVVDNTPKKETKLSDQRRSSYCSIHHSFPKEGDPCWGCVSKQNDRTKLEIQQQIKNILGIKS